MSKSRFSPTRIVKPLLLIILALTVEFLLYLPKANADPISNPKELYSIQGQPSEKSHLEPWISDRWEIQINDEALNGKDIIFNLSSKGFLNGKERRTRRRFIDGFLSEISVGNLFDQTQQLEGTYILARTSNFHSSGIFGALKLLSGESFVIKANERNGFELLALDSSEFQCGGAVLPSEPLEGETSLSTTSSEINPNSFSGDLLPIVDVMVVYTPNSVAALGGEAGMIAQIQAAIADANQSFINSEIGLELNLVHTYELSSGMPHETNSSEWSNDLYKLKNPSDGYWDEVHSLRDTYHADLVSAFSMPTSGTTAGIGYLLNGSSMYGFSIVSQFAAVGNHSFAHELGHNLGAHHDRGNASSQGYFPYSYGWRWIGNSGTEWRSVMAYLPGTRIQYFSNPNILYDGVPTGTVTDDNARTLNQTGPTVVLFRQDGTPIPTPTYSVTPTTTKTAAITSTWTPTKYATPTLTLTPQPTTLPPEALTPTATPTSIITETPTPTPIPTITPTTTRTKIPPILPTPTIMITKPSPLPPPPLNPTPTHTISIDANTRFTINGLIQTKTGMRLKGLVVVAVSLIGPRTKSVTKAKSNGAYSLSLPSGDYILSVRTPKKEGTAYISKPKSKKVSVGLNNIENIIFRILKK